jgi:hypothetical protein
LGRIETDADFEDFDKSFMKDGTEDEESTEIESSSSSSVEDKPSEPVSSDSSSSSSEVQAPQ